MSGTGAELTRVPYKGSGQLLPDFLSNRLQIVMDFPGPYTAHLKNGNVRFLATFNDKRLEGFPDLPTLTEAGFSQVPSWQGWFGMFGPRGLPEDIRARIAREVNAWLATPEAREKLASGGYIPTPEPPEAVRALMQNETEALSKLIQKYNIKKTPL
jgi:tripartite-type tricarboxylate transporter receptor subunit TctC